MQSESNEPQSRRTFLDRLGALTFALTIPDVSSEMADDPISTERVTAPSSYDLSWVGTLRKATDRGLVDSTLASRLALEVATRYLDNCDAAYGIGKHRARVVVNLRTRAVPLGVSDALWQRFALGVEASTKDPTTNAPALRNPFIDRPAGSIREEGSINELVARGAILLICDLALGHVARSVATKQSLPFADVHHALKAGLVPGAFLVPSGIFGAIRAQNAGCGYVGGF